MIFKKKSMSYQLSIFPYCLKSNSWRCSPVISSPVVVIELSVVVKSDGPPWSYGIDFLETVLYLLSAELVSDHTLSLVKSVLTVRCFCYQQHLSFFPAFPGWRWRNSVSTEMIADLFVTATWFSGLLVLPSQMCVGAAIIPPTPAVFKSTIGPIGHILVPIPGHR